MVSGSDYVLLSYGYSQKYIWRVSSRHLALSRNVNLTVIASLFL